MVTVKLSGSHGNSAKMNANLFIWIVSMVMLSSYISHPSHADDTFHLTILHTSDVTAAFEQFNLDGEECSKREGAQDNCLGGVARRATIIKEVKKELGKSEVLLLDAGDQFVGEWFSVYKGNATSHFMNELGYDAMTFGNLEFALGVDNLAAFLEGTNLDAISTNLNATKEPHLQKVVKKSVIKEIDGHRVGIVGYTVQRANKIALLRNARFDNVLTALQEEVNALQSRGVNKIIVLGHSYGQIEEGNEAIEVARKVRGVDIIVLGGALLFQCNECPFEDEDRLPSYSLAPYPIAYTPEDDSDGKVLLVHGYLDGRYIGRLNVAFDNEGRVTEWEGNPVRLDKTVEQDPDILSQVANFAEGVDKALDRVVGNTKVDLDGGEVGRWICRQEECIMGNLITDAMLWIYTSSVWNKEWNDVSMAVLQGGGIRASITKGHILMRDLVEVMPFSNTIDAVEIKGKSIREMLENSVARYDKYSGAFLQVAGIQVSYDVSRQPYFNRVVEVKVSCTECKRKSFVPLEDDKVYKIAIPSYIGNGGDDYEMFKSNAVNYHSGEVEEAVLAKYIAQFSPIATEVEGRIFVANADPEPEVVTKPFFKRMAIFGSICLVVLVLLILFVAYRVVVPMFNRNRQLKYARHTENIMINAEEASLQQT